MAPIDTMDRWEAVLEPVIRQAIDEWADAARPWVLPTLTADALPPDPDAGSNADGAWQNAFNTWVLPVLSGLMAGRVWRILRRRGITPPAPEPGPRSAAAAVPYPADWVAGLTPAARDALVTEFDDLKRLVDSLTDGPSLLPAEAKIVIEFPTWQGGMADHFATVSNRCVKMPDDMFRHIGAKLADGIEEGLRPEELRDMVHDILDGTGHDKLVPNRAALIARTETTTAYNQAAHQAALAEAAETGQEMHHVWVATVDGRTRDSHFAADGQRNPLDAPFTVGGHRLAFPGDPNAPVGEIANCRCTQIVLAADEPTPGEEGRQTEPDGQSRHRDGTQDDEIRRRADDGVVRAREDPAGVGIAASATRDKENPPMRRTFAGVLAPIGKPTGDGRQIASDAEIAFRDFPLPLMYQRATSEGHDQSVIVGRIDTAEVDGGEIVATGVLFDNADADEAATLMGEEVLRPSVDMCDMVADFLLLDSDGKTIDVDAEGVPATDPASEMMLVTSATIMAATLVAKPAFAEAKLTLGEKVDDEGAGPSALVASATAAAYEFTDFADPHLDGPTPITVDDGRVYGHLATWGTCHIGMPDRCVTPPRSATSYSHFHTSALPGSNGPIPVGRLTIGCGHAAARDTAGAAAAHYDDTGTCWAFVRAGEDEHGIWVSGIVNPAADTSSVTAGASAPLSGDWRSIGGRLELVAALSVNTPGFPIARTFANEAGAEMSLVAAGAVAPARERTGRAAIDAAVEAAYDRFVAAPARAAQAADIARRRTAEAAARRAEAAAAITARHAGGEA